MNQDVTERTITNWLARAHPNPGQAHTEWREHHIALLPLGRTFSVIRIPERLVRASLDTTDLNRTASLLADRLQGPVIRDSRPMGTPYYALIQWHSGLVWDGDEDTPCLGDGAYMGVPRLDRVTPPGPYWLVPPRDADDLCRPEMVRALIREARAAVAEVRA